jgi:hypothetical protein
MTSQTDRRTRGREAQRRHRLRKDQELVLALSRIQQLEENLGLAIDTFVAFGDHAINAKAKGFTDDLQQKYEVALKTFYRIGVQLEHGNGVSTIPLLPQGPVQLPEPPARLLASLLPAPKAPEVSVYRPDNLVIGRNGRRVPQGVLRMPTLNPISFEDHYSMSQFMLLDVPFCKKVSYTALWTTYQALTLEASQKPPLASWLATAHRFSLQHAHPSYLLHLTKSAIKNLLSSLGENEDTSPSHDDGNHVENPPSLPQLVRTEMTRSGLVVPDVLLAPHIMDYIRSKGSLRDDGTQFHLRITMPFHVGSARSANKIAVIEQSRFIRALVNGSICLGDGIGFPIASINKAIAFATTMLLDDII